VKKRKKLWILLPVLALAIAGAVYGFLTLRQRNNKAFVQPVYDLNNSWILMNNSSYGTIASAAAHQYYLNGTDPVAEIYVVEGQSVSPGDALFRYDTQTLHLELQERQISVDAYAGSLDVARRQLAAYQKIEPVEPRPDDPEDPPGYQLTDEQKLDPLPHPPYDNGVDPPADKAFYCTDQTLITGQQINQWIAEGGVISLEIWEGGAPPEKAETPPPEELPDAPVPEDPTGDPEPKPEPEPDSEPESEPEPEPLHQWVIDGRNWLSVADDSFWSVAGREQWFPPEPEEPEEPETPTYTAAQKAKLISDQELAIRRLENDLALARNALARTQKQMDDATVRATMAGTVTVICDPAAPPQDGAPFCQVTGSEGVTLTGYISELALADARVGDRLSVTSWMTGMTTDAEIISISDYPADRGSMYFYGEGNPNASFYQFTAYMESSKGFSVGEEVSIQSYIENVDQIIVLQKVYVRSDSDGAYVLLDDGTGHLARRNVTVQGTSEAEYVKILSGLELEDMVAFPYGKSARIGALTTTESRWSLF
jgi:hypothetical protein